MILDDGGGTDPQERIQTEIDIMGDQDKSTALFGECKWINENCGCKSARKAEKGGADYLDMRMSI